MNAEQNRDMLHATALTRAGRLKEALGLLRGALAPPQLPPALRGLLRPFREAPRPGTKTGAFESHSFTDAAGTRAYKLYVPGAARNQAMPLVIMLHGCTQSPDDFAAGTRMNEYAETLGFLVVYPAQARTANLNKCWNWFNPTDQKRDSGEPSLIAGITRQVMQTHQVKPGEIYIAGLSAGAAAAANIAAAYPEIFAALGIHSGLPRGAAHNMAGAMQAMRQPSPPPPMPAPPIPTIVFHGDRDGMVNPLNADHIINQAKAGRTLTPETTRGEENGASYTKTVFTEAGRPMLEQWTLHGAGHAWSGGSPAGTYTSATGPDASREMLRFFKGRRVAKTA